MPLFHITLREHTYTGRFYNDAVEAGSFKEALQLAAGQATAPLPPPDSRQRSFNVTVREHTDAGRFYNDVVEAGSFEEALRLAAAQAAGPQPPPGFRPQPDGANRRQCADVWIHSLLHCELVEGHDPPHMAVARGYWHLVRWARDDRGLAQALPGPLGLHDVPGHSPSEATRPRRSPSPSRPGGKRSPSSALVPVAPGADTIASVLRAASIKGMRVASRSVTSRCPSAIVRGVRITPGETVLIRIPCWA